MQGKKDVGNDRTQAAKAGRGISPGGNSEGGGDGVMKWAEGLPPWAKQLEEVEEEEKRLEAMIKDVREDLQRAETTRGGSFKNLRRVASNSEVFHLTVREALTFKKAILLQTGARQAEQQKGAHSWAQTAS
jgi:hypothetical protein